MGGGISHFSGGLNNAERKVGAAKRKKLWLLAFEEHGTIKASCEVAGIARNTYISWMQHDLEFVKAYEDMKRSFAESLETIALERVKNPDKGKGSDVLLITLLNSNMPWKYRPQVAMNEDYAKELIFEWRKAAKEMAKEMPKEEVLSEDVEKTLTDILEKRKGGKDTEGEKNA